MKQKKTLIILVVVLVALSGATLGIQKYQQHKDKVASLGEVILSFNMDDATAFSWTYDDTTLSFAKNDEGVWKDADNDAFPVDQEALTDLLEPLSEFYASFKIEEVGNMADYGLKSPECSITVTCGETVYTLDLGGYSSMDAERYISIGDGCAYLATEDVLEDFECELDDFFQPEEIPAPETISTLTIAGENTLNMVYLEEAGVAYSDEYLYYSKDGETYTPLSKKSAVSLIDTLEDLSLTSYASLTASSEDLSKYGLEEPSLTVTMTYTEEEEEKTFIMEFGAETTSTAYARIPDSEIIYAIVYSDYEDLLEATPTSLKAKEVVLINWDDVTMLTATVDGTTVEIDRESEEGAVVVEDLANLTLEEFTWEGETKKEELSLTITRNNDNCPEITITIEQLNGEYCVASFNGEQIGTVDRSDAVTLLEAVNTILLNQ